MADGPAISVLLPAFNGGRYLHEAVASVLDQMRDDDELLVQDGGSTDGSIDALLEAFGDRPQLKVVSAKDDGQGDALNKALARAQNPVVGWLNADDCYHPGALDAVRRGFVEVPDADLVYGGWTMFGADGEVLRVCQPAQLDRAGLMRTPQIFTGAMFMRTECMRDLGGLDISFYYCMDIDLVARILRRGKVPKLVPEVLGGFRWHNESKTGALGLGVVREAFKVRRRYAVGAGQHVEAWVFSATQLIGRFALPIRQARWYSRWRMRRHRDAEVPVG